MRSLKRTSNLLRVLLSTLLSLCLCGCAVGNPPPVVDIYQRDSKATKVTSGSHRVARGETLYSIAWRYGWDYRALADEVQQMMKTRSQGTSADRRAAA